MRSKSLAALANARVPFVLAAQWAGIEVYGEPGERGIRAWCPFGPVEHPDGGSEAAMRVYSDHGWCFSESRYFSVTSLLAEVWQLEREDAAAEALRRFGYVPADYAHLFAQASAPPLPDRDELAAALVTWCEAQCRSWRQAAYHPGVSRQLSRCLGLLPLVVTGEDCETWLNAAKEAMQEVLLRVNLEWGCNRWPANEICGSCRNWKAGFPFRMRLTR